MIRRTSEYGSFSLEEAEVGDKLMVSCPSFGESYQEVTITAVTKTRITTSDNRQWMRASKQLVGADKWSRTWLHAYDESEIQRVEQRKLRGCVVRKIMGAKLSDLDMDALKRIADI